MRSKIIRACTVPQSLGFVDGMIPDLDERYDVILLSSPGNEWAKLKSDTSLYRSVSIHMERRMSPFKDIVSLFKLINVFRKERPKMVHSMTPKAGLLCMLAAKICRVPMRIHTFTGLVFPTSTGIQRKILMATDWLTCACATHVIPEGEGVKRDLIDNGITRKDIKVLGHGNVKGIDLNHFDRTPEVTEEANKLANPNLFTFISVGRLVGAKGINELVAAFDKLNREYPKTRLLLVGPYEKGIDPLSQETMQLIENHHNIYVAGRQSDVRPWLSASDCAVLASYREGFPNVVIEAGAMGLPQIVTDINGANEIIVEGENGTIVPSKDANALYEAMKRMMLDSEWRNHMASNARQMVASRYDMNYVKQCLLDYYDSIGV